MAIEGRQIIVTKQRYSALHLRQEGINCHPVRITKQTQDGHQSVMIRSTDTDVVMLAVVAVATLDLKELWVSYETGKKP